MLCYSILGVILQYYCWWRFEVLWPPANLPGDLVMMSNVDHNEENCPILFDFFSCKRELRELCDDRVHFYQSLQESELKTAHTSAKQ